MYCFNHGPARTLTFLLMSLKLYVSVSSLLHSQFNVVDQVHAASKDPSQTSSHSTWHLQNSTKNFVVVHFLFFYFISTSAVKNAWFVSLQSYKFKLSIRLLSSSVPSALDTDGFLVPSLYGSEFIWNVSPPTIFCTSLAHTADNEATQRTHGCRHRSLGR